MKMTKFSCIEMKRNGAETVGKKTTGMTREEELVFWKEQTRNLRHFQELKKEEHRDEKVSV